MNYRDSSIATHYTRGVIASVDSSHGVRIEGGSTGAIVEPVGDDADISLTLRAKGAGTVKIQNPGGGAFTINSSGGNINLDSTGGTISLNSSGGPINLNSSAGTITLGSSGTIVVGSTKSVVQMAGSTTNFGGFVWFTDTATGIPAIGSTEQSSTMSTHVIAGCATNSLVLACTPNGNSTSVFLGGAFASLSTAGDVHCIWCKTSTAAFGGSTATVAFAVMRFS